MRRALGILGSGVFYAVAFAGVNLLIDYTIGRALQPAWGYWIAGALFGVIMISTQEGWLRGVLRDSRRRQELEKRAAELSEERERILREQRLKLRRADGDGA